MEYGNYLESIPNKGLNNIMPGAAVWMNLMKTQDVLPKKSMVTDGISHLSMLDLYTY